MNKMIDYDLNLSFSNNSHLYESSNNLYENQKPSPLIFMIYFRKDLGKYYIKAHKQPENSVGNELPYIIVQINHPYVRKSHYFILFIKDSS